MAPTEQTMIYDPIRKKEVPLTPEERVRQAVVHLLTHQLDYPPTLIANEYTITVGKLSRRCDTVVFTPQLQPLMILEYKAPHIPLSEKVIQQAFQYNTTLQVPYIALSNGHQTLLYKVGYQKQPSTPLPGIPPYQQLLQSLR
ncbi:type I restriction enzyme HsdR N-terminal domain-containing protein [uncultured Porphyromonas sp.]|uniref:type I restriction enzyme HsdR N-terminal domain-containing protein n=1 Tax=uncultured Porphyromonas sp. TaxID=159274 RepID=UPI00259BC6D6|nr:type I restriction enzyme HsdR N-terminal domain-containing protein [uncultured Porphyromonas sp.]